MREFMFPFFASLRIIYHYSAYRAKKQEKREQAALGPHSVDKAQKLRARIHAGFVENIVDMFFYRWNGWKKRAKCVIAKPATAGV